MQHQNEQGLPHDVTFDIRPGHYGGDWPLKGDFRLRSFNAILNFLGLSIAEEPEYHVEKDNRTPKVAENPVNTMDLIVVVSPVRTRPRDEIAWKLLCGEYDRPADSLEPRSVQALVAALSDDRHRGLTSRRAEHHHREIAASHIATSETPLNSRRVHNKTIQ